MPIVNWSPAYSVNVAAMDAQHKNLIDITNQLYDAMKAGKGNQELGVIIQKMADYSEKHFKEEEKLLAANNYPQMARQKAEHIAFIAKVNEFNQAAQSGKMALSISVSNYLKEWWTAHIQKEDKLYGEFLNGKGIK